MSDHVVRSDHDSDGMVRKSAHLNQSSWMAHWMPTSCKPETRDHEPSSIQYQCKVNDGDIKQHKPELPPDIPESSKGFREVSEPRTLSPKPSSMNLRKERLEGRSFPMFNLSENRKSIMLQKKVASCPEVVSEMGTLSREFRPEGISGNLEQQLNSYESTEKKSFAVSMHDVASSSKIVPFRYNKGKNPIHSFVCGREDICQSSSSPIAASEEHFSNAKSQSDFMPLIQEDKTDNLLDFGRYGTLSLRQNNMPLLLHNPTVSNTQQPVLVGKLSKKMQNSSFTRLFPDWTSPLEASNSETLFRSFYSVPRLPPSLQEVETMRIYSTEDSMAESSPIPPKISQTTHHFLITKKTDVNLSERGERFKDSTNFDGLHRFLNLSSGLDFRGHQSLKLEPLRSSIDSDGIENFGDAKTSAACLKNESSADTDTMDMDVFQKDQLSGVVSSPKNKIVEGGLVSSTLQAAIISSTEETGDRLPNTELPDISEELPELPAVASLVEDRETSSSRTQSLDAEHLLSHAELPTNSKSGAFPDVHEGSDPSIRWVKRLKLSASGSSPYGTKCSKMEEACSHEKVNRLFCKIMRCSVSSSEPTMAERPGKERMTLDETAILLRNGEASSSEPVTKIQEISLSNPWIKRWCHQRAASPMKNKVVVVCEPQKSNATLDEFQKKQYPSIAAMAMMGKALNSIQPCGFRKRGTYVVWNA